MKHRCADMAARAEAATSLTRYAALAVVDGRTDGVPAQAAWTVAPEAAVTNAQVNIQNHGGIGFTIGAHHAPVPDPGAVPGAHAGRPDITTSRRCWSNPPT